MLSYDLRQVTQALANTNPGLAPPYSPNPNFKREFSSRLSIDICRHLRDGRMDVEPVREDVIARLDSMRALAEWLMHENAQALQRDGDRAFLRLNKRPFRSYQTCDIMLILLKYKLGVDHGSGQPHDASL